VYLLVVYYLFVRCGHLIGSGLVSSNNTTTMALTKIANAIVIGIPIAAPLVALKQLGMSIQNLH
jgi:hypothetical protein